MIDTGTGAEAIIMPAVADALQLPSTGTVFLNDPSGQAGRTVPLRVMETLTVAGVDFYAIKAAEHTLVDSDIPCDGLLGFRLFQGFLLTLDYPARRFVLAEGELQPDGNRTVHPFIMPNGVPIAALTIGSLSVDALIDSGGAGLSFPESLVPQLKFASDPVLHGTARLPLRFRSRQSSSPQMCSSKTSPSIIHGLNSTGFSRWPTSAPSRCSTSRLLSIRRICYYASMVPTSASISA
jgi:predicted aspartyl protease